MAYVCVSLTKKTEMLQHVLSLGDKFYNLDKGTVFTCV